MMWPIWALTCVLLVGGGNGLPVPVGGELKASSDELGTTAGEMKASASSVALSTTTGDLKMSADRLGTTSGELKASTDELGTTVGELKASAGVDQLIAATAQTNSSAKSATDANTRLVILHGAPQTTLLDSDLIGRPMSNNDVKAQEMVRSDYDLPIAASSAARPRSPFYYAVTSLHYLATLI